MKARLIDEGEACGPPHDFGRSGTAMGMASSGAPAREAPHIQAESARRRRHDLRPYVQMRRFAAILAGLALIVVLVIGLTQAGGGSGSAQDGIDLAKAEEQLAGSPAAARRPAQAGRRAAARRAEGVPGADGEPQGLPGGGQQVGLVVRALPRPSSRSSSAGRAEGQEGRVPRRQRGRLDRSRPPLPPRRAAALPVLHRPRREDREDDPGSPRTTRSPCSSTAAASSPTSTRALPQRDPGDDIAATHEAVTSPIADPPAPRRAGARRRARAARGGVLRRAGRHLRRRPGRSRRRGAAPRGGRGRRAVGTCRMLVEPGGDREVRAPRASRVERPRPRASPPRCSPPPRRRPAPPAPAASACTRRPMRCRSTSAPATRPTASASTRRASSTWAWRSTLA